MHSSLTKKLTYDVYYQDYQGYFIENIKNRFAGIALEQRDDIRLKNIAANVSYVFNRTNNLNVTLFCIYKIKSRWMQGKKSFFEKNKNLDK